MTSAISQLVYMPNFRAIGQSVWEKNGNRQKHRQKHRQKQRQKHRNTHLNFIKIDCSHSWQQMKMVRVSNKIILDTNYIGFCLKVFPIFFYFIIIANVIYVLFLFGAIQIKFIRFGIS